MNILERLFDAQLTIAGHQIFWREIVGNAFGFASAIGGMRRRVWAWPVGIVGNVILFTVFFGVAFANPQGETLYGQAGRQVFFIITSIYGWWRWSQIRRLQRPGRGGRARRPSRGGRRRGSGSSTSASGSVVSWSCSGCSP